MAAAVRASHSTALSGLPRHAAPQPTDTGSPDFSRLMPPSTGSCAPSFFGEQPGTWTPAESDSVKVTKVPIFHPPTRLVNLSVQATGTPLETSERTVVKE